MVTSDLVVRDAFIFAYIGIREQFSLRQLIFQSALLSISWRSWINILSWFNLLLLLVSILLLPFVFLFLLFCFFWSLFLGSCFITFRNDRFLDTLNFILWVGLPGCVKVLSWELTHWVCLSCFALFIGCLIWLDYIEGMNTWMILTVLAS